MARRKNGVNKSEEIRQLLRTNPKITAKEVTATLADRGIQISENLFYFIKGQMKGRKKRARHMVNRVAAATNATRSDALATVLKVKKLAQEVGGLKSLKALVDALSE
jgi:hypothetical protein